MFSCHFRRYEARLFEKRHYRNLAAFRPSTILYKQFFIFYLFYISTHFQTKRNQRETRIIMSPFYNKYGKNIDRR